MGFLPFIEHYDLTRCELLRFHCISIFFFYLKYKFWSESMKDYQSVICDSWGCCAEQTLRIFSSVICLRKADIRREFGFKCPARGAIAVQSNFQIKHKIPSETNKRTFIYFAYKIQIYRAQVR